MNHVQLALRAVPILKNSFGADLIYRCINRGDNHLVVSIQHQPHSDSFRVADVYVEDEMLTMAIWNRDSNRTYVTRHYL